MIEYPGKAELMELLKNEQGRCVSILMPTEESGRATNQNSIRFKNLLSSAVEKAAGLDDDAANRLRELGSLEHDVEFWRHQNKGLAIFVCDGFHEFVKLGHAVDEFAYVADHFYVKPLAAQGLFNVSESGTRSLLGPGKVVSLGCKFRSGNL